MKQLTTGALMLAMYALLLWLTTYVPFLGTVTLFFLGVPFILFAYKNKLTEMVVFLVGSLLITILIGGVFALPLTIIIGAMGLTMGHLLREKKSREIIYIGSSFVSLITIVLSYAFSVALMGVDIVEEGTRAMNEGLSMSKTVFEAVGQQPNQQQLEQLEESIRMIPFLLPTMFVIISFMAVFMIQLVSFPLIKRLKVDIPPWKPFRMLQFPKAILWVYLFTMIGSMFLNPKEGSFLFMAIINIAFVLQTLMVVQGLSFIYEFAYQKNLSKSLPIILTIVVLVFSQLLYIVRILGIIDLGFDLRKRLKSQK